MTLPRQRLLETRTPKGALEWVLLVGLRPAPAAYVFVPDRAAGAIPPSGHYRSPKRRRPPRVAPGGLSHAYSRV